MLGKYYLSLLGDWSIALTSSSRIKIKELCLQKQMAMYLLSGQSIDEDTTEEVTEDVICVMTCFLTFVASHLPLLTVPFSLDIIVNSTPLISISDPILFTPQNYPASSAMDLGNGYFHCILSCWIFWVSLIAFLLSAFYRYRVVWCSSFASCIPSFSWSSVGL